MRNQFVRKTLSLVLCFVILTAALNTSQAYALDDNSKNTEYEEQLYNAIRALTHKAGSIYSMKSISELFALSPQLNQYVLNKETLLALKKVQNLENVTNFDVIVNILINYIKSDYKENDMDILRSYVIVDMITISNKTITGKRKNYSNENWNYNCHSFAWYYACNYNSSDRMWIDNPWSYYGSMYGNCYTEVTNGPTLPSNLNLNGIQLNDIVVYVAYDDEGCTTSGMDRIVHSATVTTKSGSYIQLTSKNGMDGISTHEIAGGSYFRASDGRIREVRVFRRNHVIQNSLPAGQNYKIIKADRFVILSAEKCDEKNCRNYYIGIDDSPAGDFSLPGGGICGKSFLYPKIRQYLSVRQYSQHYNATRRGK